MKIQGGYISFLEFNQRQLKKKINTKESFCVEGHRCRGWVEFYVFFYVHMY